jgi:hypothetical protein
MQIHIERSGGVFGGLMSKTVDTATLPSAEAEQIQSMVEDAKFFQLPRAIGSAGQPDRFQYEITVTEQGRKHTITAGESAVPESLKSLWAKLQRS